MILSNGSYLKTPKRVVIIAADYPRLETLCSNWHGMRKGLERLNIPYKFVTCRPDLNINEVVMFNPDLIVYGLKDMIVERNWRMEIRKRLPNAKIVMWYGDYRDDETTQVYANCSEMDAMFISNDAQSDYYKDKWKMKKVHFLPLGCEPIEKPKFNKEFAFDFVFIGGQITGGKFEDRAREIQEFRDKLNLKLVNSFDPNTRARIFELMPTIYSSSKVTLDISHFTDVEKYTSNRFWIIPAYHGFALTKRWPGCTDFYPENTRAYFDTFEEATEKLEYYLTHEDERNKMVELAHQWSYKHTYDHRWKQMFKLL